jgi:hypothetical protein
MAVVFVQLAERALQDLATLAVIGRGRCNML